MRFHVVALPHTQTTFAFSECAYTMKIINFCRMMTDRGHTVYLYAGEQNEAPCTEHIVCIDEESRRRAVGLEHYTSAKFDASLPQWKTLNTNAIREIRKRAQAEDFLCVIAGHVQAGIADALPAMTCVEYGIGYSGIFSKFRVFESYAWMHMNYGAWAMRDSGDAAGTAGDGKFYDTVIPGYLDPEMFPFSKVQDDYLLYVGRLIHRKGLDVAVQTATACKRKLVVAGTGDYKPTSEYVEYIGPVGPTLRGQLMSRATALLMPTLYVEPFGNVNIEAQACGCPVITTDWGAFTETVEDGFSGKRCHTLQEFVDAVDWASHLTLEQRVGISERAVRQYSIDRVGAMYEKYFERLLGLWGSGWNHLRG